MNITKDEAAILCQALHIAKWDIVSNCYADENFIKDLRQNLNLLEKKLSDKSEDKRRSGRTSLNDFSDILTRFNKKHSNKK